MLSLYVHKTRDMIKQAKLREERIVEVSLQLLVYVADIIMTYYS